MTITKLKDRDLDCDECSSPATHQIDNPLPGGKIDRKFCCDFHLPEQSLQAPVSKQALMNDYLRASRGY